MAESNLALFGRLGISLAIGMLVGLQREKTDASLAGVRTFALISLSGVLTALLEHHFSPEGYSFGWIVAAGIVATGGIIVASQLRLGEETSGDVGMTTAIAILIVFLNGVYTLQGNLVIAVAIGVCVAVLLQLKPELHSMVDRLGDKDIRAILQLAVFSCVVLPILPNRQMGPLNVFNPFNTWLMVVFIVGINLAGYIAYKFIGQSAGVIVGGLLGGTISSTATSFGYSRKARNSASTTGFAATVIVIASTVVFVRVLVELSVVAPNHLRQLGVPIAFMLASCIVSAIIAWWLFRGENEAIPEPTNPSELTSALTFGGLYALVLWALAATKQYLGSDALYLVAILSGSTDMDAITLTTGRMVEQSTNGLDVNIGWRLLVTASISNLVFKSVIIAFVGGRRIFWRIILLFLLPITCGVMLIVFWH